jgi:hypothetical protein
MDKLEERVGPVLGDELRALRWLQREQETKFPFGVHVRARRAVYHRRLRPHG